MDSFIEENFSESILTLTVCINPLTYMEEDGVWLPPHSLKVFLISFPRR